MSDINNLDKEAKEYFYSLPLQTQNIINKNSISLMKKSAYLINTARGGFVVEKDLANALNQEQIAGYAADVILEEPMDKNNPLRLAKNCIIELLL